jgi:adenine-specific DNA-methyltransferase
VLRQVHIFEARDQAFKDDAVPQENIIYHVRKRRTPYKTVTVSVSQAGNGPPVRKLTLPTEKVVDPTDPDRVIHLMTSNEDAATALAFRALPNSLDAMGVKVSTGRVVDFRAKAHLCADPARGTAPLIYPMHVNTGRVVWPQPGARKANAIKDNDQTADLFVPNGNYVLVRRFSSKEERRRVYASLIDAGDLPGNKVGFENHLNYFHNNGHGLDTALAHGLAAFLNTTMVDQMFRQFSGHTQVNASDLRAMRFPTVEQLKTLGNAVDGAINDQEVVDEAAAKLVFR